jgi:peptidoglycan/LPS O-acetylase OafA/YrhL
MSKRIPQLDAVRGIAILLVLVHNMGQFTFAPAAYLHKYGWAGVDLFFVLSGFLITGILLDTKSSPSYFRNFYARRCLRIWPLYYAVLVLMFVVVPLARPHVAAEIFQKSHPWWSYPFFLQNFFVAIPTEAAGALGVTWSLAVEELFYLVWPFFVLRVDASRLRTFAWVVILLSPILRFIAWKQGVLIYSNPFCRLDGLMAGALLAITVRDPTRAPSRFVWPAWIVLSTTIVLAVVADENNARWFTFSMTITASAAVVFLAMHSASPLLQRILANRFLIFTGTISYGLYLLHKFPQDAMKSILGARAGELFVFWASVICAYVLAAGSWYLFEKPFLRLKSAFENNTADRTASMGVPQTQN